MSSIYDFKVNDAEHNPYDLAQHKGHPVLIYNVASKCRFTKKGYETATTLYNKYRDRGLSVLAFPCNQFAGQEPCSAEEVKESMQTRFQADFPILDKVDVNGDKQHPLFQYLKHAQKGVLGTPGIKWNFTAFLVDKNGHAVARFAPGASVETIEKKLVPLLNEESSYY